MVANANDLINSSGVCPIKAFPLFFFKYLRCLWYAHSRVQCSERECARDELSMSKKAYMTVLPVAHRHAGVSHKTHLCTHAHTHTHTRRTLHAYKLVCTRAKTHIGLHININQIFVYKHTLVDARTRTRTLARAHAVVHYPVDDVHVVKQESVDGGALLGV